MVSESLMILYEDDSVEVHYMDRSRLLLSPCGSEFLFEKAVPASAHPMQPPERVRQRTQFAISIYRSQLLRAIDFRNQYSDRPCLPSSIIPAERKNVLFTDISEAKWPSPDNAEGTITVQNGNVTVSSLDGHTCLFLPELQRTFRVEFSCKVSQTLSTSLSPLEKNCSKLIQGCSRRSNQNSVLKLSSQQLTIKEKDDIPNAENPVQESSSRCMRQDEIPGAFQTSSEYCRITQHMSVSSCPKEWKYPLSLAFKFYQSAQSNKANEDDGNIGHDCSEWDMSKAVTYLPSALPLSCHAPYLHRWNFNDFFQPKQEDNECYLHSQPIKVLWNKDVIYRFFLRTKSIEIYPGDGSVFKSEGSCWGKYFTRYYIKEQIKQREETMYSVSNLPPDTPGNLYSVWAIITQAIRVFQHDLDNMLSLTHNYSVCCWKMSPETGGREMLPVPLASKIFPNVGRFFAYSDNNVHAVFYDGMILNMMWDFNSHDEESQIPQDAITGWCKLTSPEGAQQLIQIDQPGLYERYITTVVEWCRNLNEDKEKCLDITQHVPEENWSVAAELEKIKRFNFLVENSNIPSMVPAEKRIPSSNKNRQNNSEAKLLSEDIGEKSIAETLHRTSKIINDIDSILSSSTKQNMAKSISHNTG
ncbi:uncharacterized protein C5orf34 homolog isoform X2 [Sceloporus undulatus]|uniref:uncharacterized protein C5orf34 homolog isoform X2 n=1 Tax=Sceloporus undulatus TaxID=8520 RepID=UPI001C4C9FFA|nr:uncharacterized protein C5orf34 homolog isoform X2 [Sceloporus undulatus]